MEVAHKYARKHIPMFSQSPFGFGFLRRSTTYIRVGVQTRL